MSASATANAAIPKPSPARLTWYGTGRFGRNSYRDLNDATLMAEIEDMLRLRAEYAEQLETGAFDPDTNRETTLNSIGALDQDLARAEDEWSHRRRLERYGGPKAPDPRSVNLAARFDRARALDIVDVITRIGGAWFSGPNGRGEYKARCPFPDHEDRHPSFTANSNKGVFHCWTCDRKGDVITFAQIWFGCAFRAEALDHLEHALGLRDLAA